MLHTDLPTRADIDLLAETRSAPAVSIYVPTTPLTRDAQGDRIELKNLLKTAMSQLEDAGTRKADILAIEDLVDAVIEDDDFWAHQANSLALFAGPGFLRSFRLPNKLESMVQVSDRFHLKPLLRSISFPQDAWVLAISVGAVRLIELSSGLPAVEVNVPDLPRNFNDALGKRSHIARSGGMQGGLQQSESAMLTRYARIVDQALRPVLAGQERPLIVAGSEPLSSRFRAMSSYANTSEHVVAGSADHTPIGEIEREARKILDMINKERIGALAELYAQRENQGRATGDIAQAARAATFGAIDTLIVDMNDSVPGRVGDDGSVEFAESEGADSYGIVDEIALRAMKAGANVFAARKDDIPGGGSLAAILRFAI